MAIRQLAPAGMLISLTLSGCSANWVSIDRETSIPAVARTSRDQTVTNAVGMGKAIHLDAKQRVVLTRYPNVACAEPSPDALSAIAVSASESLSKEDRLSLAQNLALSEAAGSIGLRTQSIQLMRDAMYRLCEGYYSDALGPLSYETMLRRFQSSMVAILAIEQLTGTIRPPTIVLGGSASAGAAEQVAKYTELLDKARTAATDAKSAAAAAKIEAEKATKAVDEMTTEQKQKQEQAAKESDATKRKALEDRVKQIDADLPGLKSKQAETQSTLANKQAAAKDSEDIVKSYEQARQAAIGGGGTTAFNVTLESGLAPQAPKNLDTVAAAVREIVSDTLRLNFSGELCTSILLDKASAATINTGTLASKCIELFDQSVAAAKATAAVLAEAASGLQKTNWSDPEAAAAASEIIKAASKLTPGLLAVQ